MPKYADTLPPLIIIPTYNERENIEGLIKSILKETAEFHILVVDDNSPDKTAEIVQELQQQNLGSLYLICRKYNLGLGKAYLEGFQFAIQNGYEYIFQMDADFSHQPKYLRPIFQTALEGYDMVIGSRYVLEGSIINWPKSRIWLSYFANILTRKITKINIKDFTAGFNCIHIEVLKKLSNHILTFSGYGFQIAIKFLAHSYKFRIKEVPIVFPNRIKGKSKMSQKNIFKAFRELIKISFMRITVENE